MACHHELDMALNDLHKIKDYKNLQILKHALQSHIQRPGASRKDLDEELKLLAKITKAVEEYQKAYGITPKVYQGVPDVENN